MNFEKTFDYICHLQLDIFGLSQGLGLRPKLYCHAQNLGLLGTLQNRGDRLRLTLEGPEHLLSLFLQTYRQILPVQALVEKEEIEWGIPHNLKKLEIIESTLGESSSPSIPADLATCPQCWEEFNASDGPRSHYPFLSCTLCGPRFSVFLKSPYDRLNTTFAGYRPCAFCRSEYEDSKNRRFHAQTVACPACGPRAVFTNSKGEELSYFSYQELGRQVALKLSQGAIMAFQSSGGFALVCDASNGEAIRTLRARKKRPHRPLAVMGKNLQELSRWVRLSPESEANLTSQVSPIVVAPCLGEFPLTRRELNPDSLTLGVMLPSTPFQALLFGNLTHLVYTSGNSQGVPLACSPEEAFQNLSGVADYFLYCDRPIARPIDDSVLLQSERGNRPWRLARGVAPSKVLAPKPFRKKILALGADLKNTFSLASNQAIWTSPHQGDLENLKTLDYFKKNTLTFLDYLGVSPELVVVDRHRGYHSHQWGRELAQARNLPVLEIGHHRAHARAAAFEANWDECLNLVYDGTGLGDDGTLWGGELFLQRKSLPMEHLGSLTPLALPGGEQAILNPIRILLGHLKRQGVHWKHYPLAFVNEDAQQMDLLFENCDKGINTPLTSSMGRLFDLASVILGAQSGKVSYEAQAAIRLETLAGQATRAPRALPFKKEVRGKKIILNSTPMIDALLEQSHGKNFCAKNLSLDFHFTIAQMALEQCLWGREQSGLERVTLSGGVFCNEVLVRLVFQLFSHHGLEVFLPQRYPVNDASTALGQVLLAEELDHA
ncbi:MAG: carbamoyltransferase HypF [Bdellovibrionales bacterium GWA2_49_15]|nr:MAG: carbamoyltransferase HypF [Bdellovibrionales bacterium GWA2_49_15]